MSDIYNCENCNLSTKNFKIELKKYTYTDEFTKRDYNKFSINYYLYCKCYPELFKSELEDGMETIGKIFKRDRKIQYKIINIGTIKITTINKFIVCGICGDSKLIKKEEKVIESNLKPLKYIIWRE